MGNLHLVTGYAGQPHVSAADHATLFESTVRSGQFVTAAGSQFAAAVITNNTVRISDGELVMQGRHVKMERGAYVDITIENGSQGSMRNDLVVARFSRNAETGIEECSLVVIKGTATVADPSDPDYITGNINSGDHVNDLPLFRIPINGLVVNEPVRLFTPYESVFDYLKAALTGLLPLSGGTMTGPIDFAWNGISSLRHLNGVRAVGFRFDENTECKLTIGDTKWSALVSVTKNGGKDFSLHLLTGDSGADLGSVTKLAGTENGAIGFSVNECTLTVTCNAAWSAGWFIATSHYQDLSKE